MRDFFAYLKNPVLIETTEIFTFKIYLRTILLCYLLIFLTSFFIAILNIIKLLPDLGDPKIDSLYLFLIVVVIGPLIEEILFRLNLKMSKRNIALFLAVVTTAIMKIIFNGSEKNYWFLGAIPLFLIIYYAINRPGFPILKIENFMKSKFKYIFHLLAFTFGMLHLTNYPSVYWWMVLIIPLLTAPYIAMGYLFGYVRMKYGFSYGWLMHATVNFISAVLMMPKHWF